MRDTRSVDLACKRTIATICKEAIALICRETVASICRESIASIRNETVALVIMKEIVAWQGRKYCTVIKYNNFTSKLSRHSRANKNLRALTFTQKTLSHRIIVFQS